MIFTEFRFVVLFVVVFLVHWKLRDNRWRKLWLLSCSYLFYAAWDWRFLSLILVSTLGDYVAGRRLAVVDERVQRRRWLLASLILNLGILGFFKYFNFFVTSGGDFLTFLGLPVSAPTLQILLPVGISFYTFQTLSYSIDVYRKKIPAERNLLNLALFVAFFPQLLAGPILRAAQFLPQLRTTRIFGEVQVRPALMLFLAGYVKKACISDNIAPFVDLFYANPTEYSIVSSWLAAILFSIQLYCDFSGYSDMAIACAALLGYTIPLNFNFPYFASSVTEFFRRWHISLSLWMRDYLYVPLGASRHSRTRGHVNVMITMTLVGLWHGASWGPIFAFVLMGVGLVVHREWRRVMSVGTRWARPAAVCGVLLTFFWVTLAMVFFRAPDLPTLVAVVQLAIGLGDAGQSVFASGLYFVVGVLALVHWLNSRGLLADRLQRSSDLAFAAAYGSAAATALAFAQTTVQPFVYFQF